MAARLTPEQRSRARRMKREGFKMKHIAVEFNVTYRSIQAVMRRRGTREGPLRWAPRPGRLSLAEREEISVGLVNGETFTLIATRLGRSISTISREVANNGGRKKYRAWRSDERAYDEARRPKATKFDLAPLLVKQVEEWLEELWSPEEISRRLRIEFPRDPMMWVSHETNYQSLYVQGRGELRRELHRCLRVGRAQRVPQGRLQRKSRIPNMVMISERPAEVADRAVPGHWEGDLIIGKNSKSAVGTLVERSTRYVLLLHLGDGKDGFKVNEAMKKAIKTLPAHLLKSITWDQGNEMSKHAKFTIDTGIQIYFCDPHSPWQRGSNENTNGLLRQYMPKATDLSVHSEADLAEIVRSLNNRPRETLGFMKPSEKLAELLALTG